MTSALDKEIYAMHEGGKTVTEIARILVLEKNEVRAAITGIWLEDKKKKKQEKRLLEW